MYLDKCIQYTMYIGTWNYLLCIQVPNGAWRKLDEDWELHWRGRWRTFGLGNPLFIHIRSGSNVTFVKRLKNSKTILFLLYPKERKHLIGCYSFFTFCKKTGWNFLFTAWSTKFVHHNFWVNLKKCATSLGHAVVLQTQKRSR